MADIADEAQDVGGAGNGNLPDTVSREELYEMVWREPMLRVAERFGLSSSYLARVCTDLACAAAAARALVEAGVWKSVAPASATSV